MDTDTRPLTLDRTDLWAIHDCLAGALAGFASRGENAEPWHAASLLVKLRTAILALGTGPDTCTLELSAGELVCIDLNVPRVAYQGAAALLLRVFAALEAFSWSLPLLAADPEPTPPDLAARLAAWRGSESTSE